MTIQRRHESPALGAMMGRMLRAMVRRCSEGDTEALEQLVALEAQVAASVRAAGVELHERGYSWTEIGAVMGTSRQNARQRCL